MQKKGNKMATKLVIGLDGQGSGQRALAHAEKLARLIGDCELLVVYVIEWSPFTFQTPEENAERHKRREEEIAVAQQRVVKPAVEGLTKSGMTARGIVKHGDVADTLNRVCVEEGGEQIIVCRSSEGGFAKRLFGSATVNLVMSATVPVTVVN